MKLYAFVFASTARAFSPQNGTDIFQNKKAVKSVFLLVISFLVYYSSTSDNVCARHFPFLNRVLFISLQVKYFFTKRIEVCMDSVSFYFGPN